MDIHSTLDATNSLISLEDMKVSCLRTTQAAGISPASSSGILHSMNIIYRGGETCCYKNRSTQYSLLRDCLDDKQKEGKSTTGMHLIYT